MKTMTVAECIKWLESLNVPNAKVYTYDPETEEDGPVTGALYDKEHLVFQTDDTD